MDHKRWKRVYGSLKHQPKRPIGCEHVVAFATPGLRIGHFAGSSVRVAPCVLTYLVHDFGLATLYEVDARPEVGRVTFSRSGRNRPLYRPGRWSETRCVTAETASRSGGIPGSKPRSARQPASQPASQRPSTATEQDLLYDARHTTPRPPQRLALASSVRSCIAVVGGGHFLTSSRLPPVLLQHQEQEQEQRQGSSGRSIP